MDKKRTSHKPLPSKVITPAQLEMQEGRAPTAFIVPDLIPGRAVVSPFSITRQGTATNELSKQIVVPGTKFDLDRFTGVASINRGGFQLSFINPNEFTGLKGSTHRLLDALIMVFTENGSRDKTVRIPLREYMELCGLKNIKETRRQVNADLWTLRQMGITFTDKTSGVDRNYINVSIAQAHGIANSVIALTWGDVFYDILRDYPTMPLHRLIFRLNPRLRPHSRPLFRKIQEHKRINAGKPSEDTLSVTTLLSVCPEMPTYEKVMTGNRNLYDLIIKPFEENMDALEEALSWEYCHTNGTPLTEEELAAFTYEIFITLLVKTTWRDYPDQTALIEAKSKRRANAERRKAASKKGKK